MIKIALPDLQGHVLINTLCVTTGEQYGDGEKDLDVKAPSASPVKRAYKIFNSDYGTLLIDNRFNVVATIFKDHCLWTASLQ